MRTLEKPKDRLGRGVGRHRGTASEAGAVRRNFDRALFAEVLDWIDDPYVVFRTNGAVVCRNLAFDGLMDDGHALEDEGRRLAIGSSQADGPRPLVRKFTTATASYRLRLTQAGASTDPSRLLLVSYERTTATQEPLAARYRLTPRELNVAELVAEGHTNSAVAAVLGVSPHTVRHHVARLLAKLGARRRGEIAARFWKR